MEQLRAFLLSLPTLAERCAFAEKCGTSYAYLKKACNARQSFGVELVIAIERGSGGVVTRAMLRPDVDWAFLRDSPLSTKLKVRLLSRKSRPRKRKGLAVVSTTAGS